ncbi:hypothetical protein AVEN_82248-1 [Araneus ventricosus]|uniref:Uncharacterized protein n=1 Tax=Araneus ventricosus TaxID=182803 RepID=A0A4Y2HDL3_ARAVE|nr:hypothetical protein AVEN_82248-1 [Araneus ventricosus]
MEMKEILWFLQPVWATIPDVYKSYEKLVSCVCKEQCSRCRSLKNGLQSTQLSSYEGHCFHTDMRPRWPSAEGRLLVTDFVIMNSLETRRRRRGGLAIRSRLWGRSVPGSKIHLSVPAAKILKDTPCMCAWCTLTLLARVKRLPFSVAWKFGKAMPAQVPSSLSVNGSKLQDPFQNCLELHQDGTLNSKASFVPRSRDRSKTTY